MAKLINPTRMELNKYKKRLKTAVRGHKLLKDKQDEMARQFMLNIRNNMELRRKVEEKLAKAMKEASFAAARMGSDSMNEALLVPARSAEVSMKIKNIMSVNVPKLKYLGGEQDTELPYGFAFSSGELDGAVMTLADLLPDLIQLASVEKTCDMLAEEMEKTRRRVNALEFVMIPEMEEAIKYISMKLEDNERSNITRLMKIKEQKLAKESAQ